MTNIFEQALGNYYVNRISFTLIVIAATLLIYLVLEKLTGIVLQGVRQKVSHERLIAKTNTIKSVIKNILQVTLFLMAFLIILAQWGVNIAPILAGAGIVGLAVSFGAQSLVKDFLSGIFIIIEDQFDIGDKVKIGNLEGIVHKMTLRITILKDKGGNLIYIPNSQITTVIKYFD